MDEKRYLDLAHQAFDRILDAFDDVDFRDADVETTGDVITITWRDRSKCIVNTQRPARQIWLAGGDRAWHFSWDEAKGAWLDDKGSGAELVSTVVEIARTKGLALEAADPGTRG